MYKLVVSTSMLLPLLLPNKNYIVYMYNIYLTPVFALLEPLNAVNTEDSLYYYAINPRLDTYARVP